MAFLIGPVLGFMVLFVRKTLPESPRWLIMHGRTDEAEAAMRDIEQHTLDTGGDLQDVDESKAIEVRPSGSMGFFQLAVTPFRTYPRRSFLGATLMITQSFLYHAMFFTYANVLTKVFAVPSGDTELYFMAFAFGNLLGPLSRQGR